MTVLSVDCKLVDYKDIRPILGRKACTGMSIVKYSDNDAINKPTTGNASVYSVDDNLNWGMSKESLPDVFAEEVGQLDGEYHIKMNPSVSLVQHLPRRVAVAMRKKLKSELERIKAQDIITPVTTPKQWVSSLVVVPKKDEKLRLCLDPKDLNLATQREHYPLPTIEDVAIRLHGAKVFTKLHVRNGF